MYYVYFPWLCFPTDETLHKWETVDLHGEILHIIIQTTSTKLKVILHSETQYFICWRLPPSKKQNTIEASFKTS